MPQPFLGFTADDVEALQGGDGGAFRDFMKQLIRGHMRVIGIPDAEFYSDSTNMKDGGCDVEVRAGAKDATGHLDDPTCWQFKAMAATAISDNALRKEINKPYATTCVKAGRRFVMCVADDITAKKAAEWESVLDAERQKINPAAPKPRVYGAEKIAAWCSSYPALVLNRRGVEGFSAFATWGSNITAATPKYVSEKNWEATADHLRQHVDFNRPASQACVVLHGRAGVGKTRLVYEILNGVPGVESLCLYSIDEDAVKRLASLVAGDKQMRLIIVADECLNDTRQKLEAQLVGHLDRVRVIAINNARERPYSKAVELDLDKLPKETVAKILEDNFPGAPLEIRQEAVRLSRGFVKIASDLCRHGIPHGIAALGDYIAARLGNDTDYTALCALALFTRVGFKGEDKELAAELELMAKLTGFDPEALRNALERIKASVGFVVIAGRYFYVTPEAVAQHCFAEGWKRWAADDLAAWHGALSTNLRASFEEQLKAVGSNSERAQFAAMISAVVHAFEPHDLTDKKKARQLVSLVETNPDAFLTTMRRLVEAADDETITAFSSRDEGGSSARRQAIWLCEHLAAFPEYFYDVETILFRLALTESETSIANNATAIWHQIHRIHLSGSSLPFLERFALLTSRFRKGGAAVAVRCFDAATDNLGGHFMRMGSPPVVAGRVPPPDWSPVNQAEMSACFGALLEFFKEAHHSPDSAVSAHATHYFVEHVGLFLRNGMVDFVRGVLGAPEIVAAHRAKIIAAIDDYLRFEKKRTAPGYLRRVEKWREDSAPRELEDRLKTMLAFRYSWLPEDDRESARPEFKRLVHDLFRESALIAKHLAWLNSPEAMASFELGQELGLLDKDASLFGLIQSDTSNSAPLLRGYLAGLLKLSPTVPAFLVTWLDEKMKSDPVLAFHVAGMFPDRLNGWARILTLAEQQQIPPRFVGSAFSHAASSDVPLGSLGRILRALRAYPDTTRKEALGAAADLADSWFDTRAEEKLPLPAPSDGEFWNPLVELVAQFDPNDAMEHYHWSRLAERVLPLAPQVVIRKAVEVMEEDLHINRSGSVLLSKAAKIAPDLVIEELGRAIADPKNGYKLVVRGCTNVLCSLPVETVLAWVRADRANRAKLFASSLPRPYVDDNSQTIVPPLTEAYLQEFGDDEKTARRFIGGSGVRSYSGDIVGAHRKEAEVAHRFRGHRIAAIRDWAATEEQRANHGAEWWQQKIEEEAI